MDSRSRSMDSGSRSMDSAVGIDLVRRTVNGLMESIRALGRSAREGESRERVLPEILEVPPHFDGVLVGEQAGLRASAEIRERLDRMERESGVAETVDEVRRQRGQLRLPSPIDEQQDDLGRCNGRFVERPRG